MDQSDIRRIRLCWSKVTASSDAAGEMFYFRLFKIAPGTRRLFKGDMKDQRMKLMTTLDFIVDHLDQLDALVPEAIQLAARHVKYGVSPEQYAPVGEALIWTVQQVLGPAFTDEDRQAWERAYDSLTGAMIAAAYDDGAAPAT